MTTLQLQSDPTDFATSFSNDCARKVIRLFVDGKLTRDQARSWLVRVRKYAKQWWNDWAKIGLDYL